MTIEPTRPDEDQTERLLRDYFLARMPAFSSPRADSNPAIAERQPLLARGRWVLAVCAALVACTLGFLVGQNPTNRPAPAANLNQGSARPKAFPALKPAPALTRPAK